MSALTPEQIAKRGAEIYQEKYKEGYEPAQNGKFLAIEVESGEAFLSDTLEGAYQEGHKKFPDKLFHIIKIGFSGVFSVERNIYNLKDGWVFS